MTHALHYGSSVFEGIRFYQTPDGPAVFRLDDHLVRFYDSARIYRMNPGVEREELREACLETVRRNGIGEGYLRPLAYRGIGALGLNPSPSPVETLVVAWAWGRYLGAEALEQGVDVCVSTWTRPAPNTHPTLAKAGGNYINSCLMKMEALENGYADAIALGAGGTVSEGSGQNLFLVRDGVLRTPALDGTMLAGVTRDSVIRLARRLEIPVEEGIVPRETLYTADELFFTGTASELTPIRSVDRIPVGSGRPGPVTRRLQEEYLAVVRGEREDVFGWLDRVEGMAAAAAG
jgi:branched-chain amino acid aminotransferase